VTAIGKVAACVVCVILLGDGKGRERWGLGGGRRLFPRSCLAGVIVVPVGTISLVNILVPTATTIVGISITIVGDSYR
jgi:hypothetical protein